MFAPVQFIEKALKDFEELLTKNLPIPKDSKSNFSKKLALIHCEFNAIHPFREGNGRIIRLFLDMIVVSLEYNPIDYSKSKIDYYLKACQDGMNKDYKKMETLIYKGLKKR